MISKDSQDKLKAIYEKSQFKNFARGIVSQNINSVDAKKLESTEKDIAIMMSNFHRSSKNDEKAKIENVIGKMTEGVKENSTLEEIGNIIEGKVTTILEATESTTFEDMKSSAVRSILLTGQVYTELLTHKLATVIVSDETKITYEKYSAKIANTRGRLIAGTDVFNNMNGFLTGDKIEGEQMSPVPDGIAVNFPNLAIAHKPLDAFDKDNDVYVAIEYIWDNAGVDTVDTAREFTANVLHNVEGGAVIYGSVDRTLNQISLTLPHPPKAGTKILVSYGFKLIDESDIVTINFPKDTTDVKTKANKVIFRFTIDGYAEVQKRGGSLVAYLEATEKSIIRNDIDIRNMNIMYKAAKESVVIWDKTIPAGISAFEHYQSVKFAVSDAIAMIAAKKDKNVSVTYKAVVSTKVAAFFESLSESSHEIYRTLINTATRTVTGTDAQIVGNLMGQCEVYIASFLDNLNRGNSTIDNPIQQENEIMFVATVEGQGEETTTNAVFLVHELLRFDGEVKTFSTGTHERAYTSQTGLKVIDKKLFALMVIDNF